jgi:hypothetical protein
VRPSMAGNLVAISDHALDEVTPGEPSIIDSAFAKIASGDEECRLGSVVLVQLAVASPGHLAPTESLCRAIAVYKFIHEANVKGRQCTRRGHHHTSMQ